MGTSNKKYKNQKRIFETVKKERKNFFDRAFFKTSLISKSVKIYDTKETFKLFIIFEKGYEKSRGKNT